jgi:hypothetical protein
MFWKGNAQDTIAQSSTIIGHFRKAIQPSGVNGLLAHQD